ncbi:MAG: SO2930 family diheme c-type cytochrome [Hyphomonadaceae bacterium]
MRRWTVVCAGLVAGLLGACSGPGSKGPDLSVILADAPAPNLSDYGFDLDHPGEGDQARLVRYDLVNPLFSDHADKHRYVFVPEGETAVYKADGAFDFPVGSVLIKTFGFAPDMRTPAEGGYKVETRLLIRKETGWIAYPYIWNEDQSEATYAPVGGARTIDTITEDGEPISIAYEIPNKNQCKTCHQSNKVMTPIGPTAHSLNHVGPNAAEQAGVSQIADWTARGLLTGAPADPADIPSVPDYLDASAPLEPRARAWLDINCAHCHSSGGGASNSGLFLRYTETNPTGWGVRKRPVAAGRGAGDNSFVIEPGHPEQSILVYRLESTEPGVVMPELGRTTVQPESLDLIRRWIASMPADHGGASGK